MAARWISLTKSDVLHINKLIVAAQRERDRKAVAFLRDNPDTVGWCPKKQFGPIAPSAVVERASGATYSWEAGWNWLEVDESRYSLWFLLPDELEQEISAVVQRERHTSERKRQQYAAKKQQPEGWSPAVVRLLGYAEEGVEAR